MNESFGRDMGEGHVLDERRGKRGGRREWKGDNRRWSLEHVTGMTSRFVFVSVSDIPPFYLIVQGQVCL